MSAWDWSLQRDLLTLQFSVPEIVLDCLGLVEHWVAAITYARVWYYIVLICTDGSPMQ